MPRQPQDLRALGEFGLIARLDSRLQQRPGVRLGIGDDAAVLDGLQAPLVTCDCLVETVHFRRDWTTPRQLGRKALTVNVSDIAAMGGRPVAAFVTLALSPNDDLNFVDELSRGMEEVAAIYGVSIAGGDTSRSPSALMISITLVGESPRRVSQAQMTRDDSRTDENKTRWNRDEDQNDFINEVDFNVETTSRDVVVKNEVVKNEVVKNEVVVEEACPVLRSGARPGDVLLVTGTLGDSAAGHALLQNPTVKLEAPLHEYLLARHHDPQARLEEMHAALGLPSLALHGVATSETASDARATSPIETPTNIAATSANRLENSATRTNDWRASLRARYPRRVRAALDLSDGLAGDAAHIARRSGVSIEIDAARLPISAACREAARALGVSVVDWALGGGEDYELLLCVAPDDVEAVVEDVRARTGTLLSIVGKCTSPGTEAVVVFDETGRIDAANGWKHF